MERAVSFEYEGKQLFGILHEPEGEPRPSLGFVFPHSGSRGRLGNTFHYPYFARALAKQGYPVLRFDPPGLGDSGGTIETGPTYDLYNSIQSGCYVGDTVAAIDELRRLSSPKKVVLLGVCGGAITALQTAAVADVAGTAIMSVPVMLDSSQQKQSDTIPTEYARKYLFALYARKLLSPRAWWRFMRGKSQMSVIVPYLSAALRRTRTTPTVTATTASERDVQANPRFFEAARALMQRDRKTLAIFGDDDPFWWHFEREFYKVHCGPDSAYHRLWEIHLLKDCNHMLTMREWKEKAMELVLQWLPRLD